MNYFVQVERSDPYSDPVSDEKRLLIRFALVGALLGLLLSQYAPLFGAPLPMRAEPWSMLRKTLAGPHMIASTLASLVVGWLYLRIRPIDQDDG